MRLDGFPRCGDLSAAEQAVVALTVPLETVDDGVLWQPLLIRRATCLGVLGDPLLVRGFDAFALRHVGNPLLVQMLIAHTATVPLGGSPSRPSHQSSEPRHIRFGSLRCQDEPKAYQTGLLSLLVGVNALAWSETRGPYVAVHSAPDASGETTVWGQAAGHFRRWRGGSAEAAGALDDLVRCLTPVLWHVVRSYGLDRDQSEDVVQTAWLTLVRRHESIADPQAVASWLTTTARREAWRVSRMDSRATPIGDEVIEARIPAQQAAEVEVVQIDERDRLWACVNRLDARCQRLLRIVAFDDRPDYRGIARDLDMPVGSIGPTRGRCLGKLKALLGEDSGADHE